MSHSSEDQDRRQKLKYNINLLFWKLKSMVNVYIQSRELHLYEIVPELFQFLHLRYLITKVALFHFLIIKAINVYWKNVNNANSKKRKMNRKKANHPQSGCQWRHFTVCNSHLFYCYCIVICICIPRKIRLYMIFSLSLIFFYLIINGIKCSNLLNAFLKHHV